ncbi:Calcium-binding EF-hand [Corchorus capsularis]|uniref:Calcium-binding EF-hand n=1 Tax=Corchorus capsularis TaxID=210143 RepID=A0A1R3KNU8_COCAP|nr:Calcium-binding EF-hand [Corchorus capsularis]
MHPSAHESRLNVDKGCPRTFGPQTSKLKDIFNIFKRFDCDKDGRFSKEELKKAFSELGSRVPVLRTLAALHHADENGDGFISDEELEALLQYALGLGYTIKME